MAVDYNIEQCKRLAEIIREADLHVARAPSRYEPGTILERAITGVFPASEGRATFEVERFIGGGFAGQVYRVKLLELNLQGEPIPGLEPGRVYAIKIIVPPSRFSELFRNAIFAAAYQSPFAAQVNFAAARSGVLWQKLFRRGARIQFGDERHIADTYATFFDGPIGSYGEINEWIEGRVWRFEVDNRVFKRGKETDISKERSPEYLAKKRFMASMVRLCHDMGAPEFARQYEWWTCKSQPNVLKRGDEGPLTAIDFRAGLALLPFLPMSPADIPLIFKGLLRGDLVQFDRGNIKKLLAFCEERAEHFDDLAPAIEELQEREAAHRASLLDITHHGLRPLYDRRLRTSIKNGYIEGWTVRRQIDADSARVLRSNSIAFCCVLLIGIVPLLGKFFRRMCANFSYRHHVFACLTSTDYLRQRFRATQAETLIKWHRAGRVGEDRIDFFLRHPVLFWILRVFPGILPLPAKWHRAIIEPSYAWRGLVDAVTYPIRFYRDADFRVQWLTDEIESGAAEGMLTEDEKDRILARVPDPYIQKYLKCVAVHFCTLPVTQVVSVIAATAVFVWAYVYQGKTWETSALLFGAVIAAFQVFPISPGSIARGSYVIYLMIRERNFRNYWIAASVSCWKYIGYLAFPLQMVTEFPALSRFMGGRWATKMVHFIPVFGERGALLEHVVFDAFFNVPLTMKRWFFREEKHAPEKEEA